jgi:hypothetical protein
MPIPLAAAMIPNSENVAFVRRSIMASEQNLDPKTLEPTGVQRDSETPTPKKPSVLFLLSTSIGVLLIILLSISIYSGISPQ